MKKLKFYLSFIFIILLFIGLWYKNSYTGKSYKEAEFLFDTTCSITAYGKESKKAVKEAFNQINNIHKLTDFFSKPVLSIYNGTSEGIIKTAYFDKKFKKLKYLVLFDDMDNISTTDLR